jgi:hypothetical protein
MQLECEAEYMKNIFLFEYKDISLNKPCLDEAYPLLYTDFGKMLFSYDACTESTKKIKLYIDYLNLNKRSSEIQEYNEIV